MKRILTLLALFAGLSAFGQEAQGNIPADVFYMLPEFGKGMVYFSDQGPAQGEMNVCAVDQTLRFTSVLSVCCLTCVCVSLEEPAKASEW